MGHAQRRVRRRGATTKPIDRAQPGRVTQRRVEVGAPLGSEIEIRSGLSGEEQVVVAGQQNLREGSPVKLAGGAQ